MEGAGLDQDLGVGVGVGQGGEGLRARRRWPTVPVISGATSSSPSAIERSVPANSIGS